MTMFRFFLLKQQTPGGIALFAGGYTGSASATTEKYKFSNDALSSGTNLTTASWSHGATSLAAYALFGGGYSGSSALSSMQKYTHASDGLSSGTSLLLARASLAAGNDLSIGIFGGGDTNPTVAINSAVTDRYTFSSSSVSAGTNLGTSRRNLAACASSTIVYFAAGYAASAVGVVDKYAISTDAISSGTSITARWGPAASSNSTDGYFFSGEPQYTLNQQYSFSSDVVSNKTSLSGGRRVPAAAGNSSISIVSAGENSSSAPIKTSEKYTYSSNSMASGTSLANAKHSLSAASSTPGHL